MTWPHSPVKQLLYLLLLLFLTCLIIANFYLVVRQPFYQTDFRSFYAAAQILNNQPQNLYNFETQKTYQFKLIPDSDPKAFRELIPFVNPPIFLLPFLILVHLPPGQAYLITAIVNTGLLIIANYLLIKLFPQVKLPLLLFLLALAFSQSYAVLIMGQSSFLTLLIFIAVYFFLIKERYMVTGLIASLIMYKPQLGVALIPYLIFLRKLPVFVGLLSGCLLLLIISTLMTSGHLTDIFISWLTFIDYQPAAPPERITYLGLFSQLAAVWPFFPVKLFALAGSLLTVWLAIKIALSIKLKSPVYPMAFSILIVATLLSAVHAHGQEAVLLFFPLYYFSQSPNFKLFIIIAVGWLTFGLYNYSRFHTAPSFIFPTLYLFVLLLFLSRKLYLRRSVHYPE